MNKNIIFFTLFALFIAYTSAECFGKDCNHRNIVVISDPPQPAEVADRLD